jgi:endonuclease YncB( thermonuclease family)
MGPRKAAVIALGLALGSEFNKAVAGEVTVLSVGDGDTLAVIESGRKTTIRLACIDAPETTQSPYGNQARTALRSLAPVGSSVTVKGGKRDRYGRTIAEIWRGNNNINLELVRRGDAFVYRQYLIGCDRNAYLSAEKQAEYARRGVWSVSGGITKPWDWRHGESFRPRQSRATLNNTKRSGRYRCADVSSWAKAQELLNQGHTYLDGDRDGEACENLRKR